MDWSIPITSELIPRYCIDVSLGRDQLVMVHTTIPPGIVKAPIGEICQFSKDI